MGARNLIQTPCQRFQVGIIIALGQHRALPDRERVQPLIEGNDHGLGNPLAVLTARIAEPARVNPGERDDLTALPPIVSPISMLVRMVVDLSRRRLSSSAL